MARMITIGLSAVGQFRRKCSAARGKQLFDHLLCASEKRKVGPSRRGVFEVDHKVESGLKGAFIVRAKPGAPTGFTFTKCGLSGTNSRNFRRAERLLDRIEPSGRQMVRSTSPPSAISVLVFHRALPDLQRMKLLLPCGHVVGTEVGILLVQLSPSFSWTRGSLSTSDCGHGPSSAPEHAS
jgi:hypothetical protein